ncbi:MAG: HAMP domain-containing sensor histidine kinase [Myxococcaceae bacterium]
MRHALVTLSLGLFPVLAGVLLVVYGYRAALHQRVVLTGELVSSTARVRAADAVIERLKLDRGGKSAQQTVEDALAHAGSPAERQAYAQTLERLKSGAETPEEPLVKLSKDLGDNLGPAWESADESVKRAATFTWGGAALALFGPLTIAVLRARRPQDEAAGGEAVNARQIELLLRDRLEQLYAVRNQAGDSARFAAFGEVAAGLSHGLKTPIASILAAAQLGQLKVGETHAARAQLDDIIREAEGLLEQVQRFLRAAAAVGPSKARVELRELLKVLDAAYSTEAKSRGLKFSVLPEVSATVEIDQALLEMALRNLVENALASSPSGGEVRVTVTDAPAPPRAGLEGEAPKASKWVAICVDDQGPGLPATARQGQTGVTSKSQGSGLGMAIARRVVERHGGALSLEDREGGGARVRVLLPWEETK